ncbi:CD3072 family TudS-related putative desulfidase [Methanococcus voltae]|uniref:Secreted protein n=1 Tax=Methanococcus voltae PS TaxID=523842 RepID=A0ABT2EWE4_METVO|nr:CD3072 family TudS-related putative desulfidase [Methanococcus voltae]MBP2172605.1 putative secreted protein [Methanococcus voltae]MCS3922277.1 putative secreted protein [Methanococcus voltae PS]
MAIVAHCILNGNAKVEGICEYEGALKDVVNYLMDANYGIIQLPCPETIIYGIKRWGHVKEQFDTPHFREQSQKMLKPVIQQIMNYKENGYTIDLLVGVDGSPSCGIYKTCSGSEWGGFSSNSNMNEKINKMEFISEKGIFMDELINILEANQISMKYVAIDENDVEESLKYLKSLL